MMKIGRNILLIASLAVTHSGMSDAMLAAGRAAQGWGVDRSIGQSPRPWLRRKKGRGAQ